MRIVSRKISRHVRRRTIRSGGGAGGSSSAKISGNSAAGTQRSSPIGRSSFVRINRPSFFHSRSVSRSTGPYSRPSKRIIHWSGIGLLYSLTLRVARARSPGNFLLMLVIVLMIFGTSDRNSQDQEQDQDHEHEVWKPAPLG